MRRRAFALAFGLAAGFLSFTAACIDLARAVLLRVRYLWLLAEVVVGWLYVDVEESGLVIVGEVVVIFVVVGVGVCYVSGVDVWRCAFVVVGTNQKFYSRSMHKENNPEIMVNPLLQYLRKYNFHVFTQVLYLIPSSVISISRDSWNNSEMQILVRSLTRRFLSYTGFLTSGVTCEN